MTGPDTGSPPSGPRLINRAMARVDQAVDFVVGVRNADNYTSLVDISTASQLRKGFRPDQLDRNGRLLAAVPTQES